MAETQKTLTSDIIACAIPGVVAIVAVVISLLNGGIPAVVLAVVGLAVGIAEQVLGDKLGHGKKGAQVGFVIAVAGCVFVVSYVALSYAAFLAVQSF